MSIILGLDGQLGYSAVTLQANPPNGATGGLDPDGIGAWTNLILAKDVTSGIEDREADISHRVSEWAAFRGTLRDISLEFQMEYDPAHANFAAMKLAWFNRRPMAFMVADGDLTVAGSQGILFDGLILTFSRPEALEDSMKIDITIRPTDGEVPPDWHTLAPSA